MFATVDVREPAFFLASTVIPIGSSWLYISSTTSVSADLGPVGCELDDGSIDFFDTSFYVPGASFFSEFRVDGAFNPPILLDDLVGVGPDKPESLVPVPKDVCGLAGGALTPDGPGVLAADAPVAVGFLNPPPILGLFDSLGDGFAAPPLDEFIVSFFSPAFAAVAGGLLELGTPRRDYTPPYLPLFVFGVETVSVLSVFADALVDAVDGLIPTDGLAPGTLGFYNVSTKPYNFLISSLTFSICIFI